MIARALAVALACGAAAAHAQEIDRAQMIARMHEYFAGEKAEGPAFASVGAAAVALGGGLQFTQHDFARGMSYSLFAVAAIELGAGAVVYFRTDAQVRRLDAQLAARPAEFRARELARMRRVNANFRLLAIIETSLVLGGAAMGGAGRAGGNDTVAGAGFGLVVQATAMLVLDHLAHRRGLRYQDALERFRD